ncbi:MAG: isoprenylcysteine carboxylmethyltransferase family protein [bacterium]
MSDGLDDFMRAALVIEFVGVLLVRGLFAGLQWGEPKGRQWRESPVFLLGVIPLLVGLVFSTFDYLSFTARPWTVLGLSDAVRWTGFAASLAVSALLVWVFATIGTAGAKHIVTFDDMKLATTGPYSRVRHPMYGGFFLWGLTFILCTDNWAVGGWWVAMLVFIAIVRVPHEERVLVEHFGAHYQQYMRRTNRFLPFGGGATRESQSGIERDDDQTGRVIPDAGPQPD